MLEKVIDDQYRYRLSPPIHVAMGGHRLLKT